MKGISMMALTGWRSVNFLYFPDSIEIASFEGLTKDFEGLPRN